MIYTVGGTVQAGGGLYVQRKADVEMLTHCLTGEFTYVLTSRQLGKSSLMVRTASQLEAEGVQTAVIDLTELGVHASPAEWYLGLLFKLTEELQIECDLFDWWLEVEGLGLTQRLVTFFRQVVFKQITSPIVIFIDEIDSTLALDYTDDFFAAIRYMYNARATEPAFGQLAFALIGVATPSDLIDDPKRTPFNIGERIELDDFTFAEALPFARGLGQNGEQVLAWVFNWTKGHPYLTQRLCKTLVEGANGRYTKKSVTQIVQQTLLGEQGRGDSNLQFVRDMLTKRVPNKEAILKTYREIRVSWQPIPDEEQSLIKSHLKLSGIVRRNGNILTVRNPIYRAVFDRHWIRTQLPNNWWQDLPWEVRMATGAIGVLLMALLVSLVLLVSSLTLANDRADLAHSRYLLAESVSLLDSQYDLALLLSLEAAQIADTAETADSLRYTLAYNPYLQTYLRGHTAPVDSLAFHPNGQLLASGSQDGQVRLWDTVTYQPLQAFAAHATVTALAFTPDGSQLVSGGCADADCQQGEIHIWSLDGDQIKQHTLEAHHGEIVSLAFNAQGTLMASASPTQLIIWQTATWEPVQQVQRDNSQAVVALAFEPNRGQEVAIGGEDGSLTLLDAQTGQPKQTLTAHRQRIYKVAFSPNGAQLASASRDGQVKVWDTRNWQAQAELTAHNDQVIGLAFNDDGQRLASTSLDGRVIVWHLPTASPQLVLEGHQGAALEVAFSHDQLITSGPDESLIVWDVQGTNGRFRAITPQYGATLDVDFSPDGSVLASVGADGRLSFWHTQSQTLITEQLGAHEGAARRVAFASEAGRLASAGADQQVQLWQISEQGVTAQPLQAHVRSVRSVAFQPDGFLLASSGDDSQIWLWDSQTGDSVAQLSHGNRELFAVVFSPDGAVLASGSWDGTVQLWSAHTHQPLGDPIQTGIEQIWSLAFSPDGSQLAVVGSGERIVLLDVVQREIATQWLTPHVNRINAVAFSPNGTLLATGGSDRQLVLWDVATQQMVGYPFTFHDDEVYGLAFSPNGRLLATSDLSGKIGLLTIYQADPKQTICEIVQRNLTLAEWERYVGSDYTYQSRCLEDS